MEDAFQARLGGDAVKELDALEPPNDEVSGTVDALCYILPGGPGAGTTKDYAAALLAVAERLGLPETYLEEIRRLAR